MAKMPETYPRKMTGLVAQHTLVSSPRRLDGGKNRGILLNLAKGQLNENGRPNSGKSGMTQLTLPTQNLTQFTGNQTFLSQQT